MLEDPDLIRRILEDIFALGVAGEQELVATIYLTGTSRLLDRPLAAIVQGTSSSGKSFPIRKVAGVFPPETVLHATQMSPQALFYMEPGSLRHKFVVAGERSRLQRDEAAEATRALREMISEGCLDKRVSMKVAGTIRTIHLHQEGPIAYVESTTQTSIFAEDANRALLLQTDESSAQTRRVLRKVASTYGENIGGCEAENIITRHWAAQRMLRSYAVCIPYAERLAALFPDQRVEARRAVGHIMNMIAAVALLHQRQRETDPDGRLVATGEDFQIARRLLDHPMARLVGRRISNAALRFRDRLEGWASGGNFSTRDATQKENATDRSVRGWLGELHRAGYMELVAEPRGKEPAIWRLAPQGPSEHVSILPTVAELFPELPDSLSGSAHDLAMKDVAPEIDVSSG
ncbi:MAG TPA: hypothetical protein DCX07_14355 [Phycisphaerales bacterium]|nr:hypothetical protein [Phycisphaerales bacterium]